MKKFTINNDVFIKDKIHSFNIYNYLIISMLPILLINIYYNTDCLLYTLLSIILGLVTKIILNDKYNLNIKEIIIMSIIINILVVNISNLIIFIFINLFMYILHIIFIKNKKILNPILFSILLYYIISTLTLSEFNTLNYYNNNLIFLIFLILGLIYLILKKILKLRIILNSIFIYLVLSVILLFFNKIDLFNILNIYNFIIIIYLIGSISNSPLNKKTQKLYGILSGIILVFSHIINNYILIYMLLLALNVFITYLDNYFIYKNV